MTIAADRPSERRILATLSACAFISAFATRFVDPMVGVIARDLARPVQDVALLASAYALPYALVQLVLGPLGDALGKERIIRVCLVVLTAAIALCALSPDLESLIGMRIVSGAAGGGIVPLVLATVGDRVPMERRQVAISRVLFFAISGQLMGGSLSGILTGPLGWRGVFWLGAGISGLATIGAIAGFGRVGPSGGRFVLGIAVARYRHILSLGRARALYLFVLIEGCIVFGVQPYIAPSLEARGAGGSVEAGLIIAAFATGGLVYILLVPILLRRLGLGRMLAIAGIGGGAAFLLLATEPGWRMEAGLFMLLGLAFYMLHNSFQTQVTGLTEEGRASAVAGHAASFFIGQAVGPPLVGYGLLVLGAPTTLVLAGTGILMLGLVSAFVLGGQPRAR